MNRIIEYLVVAVVSVLPLKGGLLLPQKSADQNKMDSSEFFLLFLVVMFSCCHFCHSWMAERMRENPLSWLQVECCIEEWLVKGVCMFVESQITSEVQISSELSEGKLKAGNPLCYFCITKMKELQWWSPHRELCFRFTNSQYNLGLRNHWCFFCNGYKFLTSDT